MNLKEETITTEMLNRFDALYEAYEDLGILGRRHVGLVLSVSYTHLDCV